MGRTALSECLRCVSRCAVERMHCGNQAENVQFKILYLLMDHVMTLRLCNSIKQPASINLYCRSTYFTVLHDICTN
jgi:hypothetical protein